MKGYPATINLFKSFQIDFFSYMFPKKFDDGRGAVLQLHPIAKPIPKIMKRMIDFIERAI